MEFYPVERRKQKDGASSRAEMAEETLADRLLKEVFQKETGRRLQVGADLLAFFEDGKSILEFGQPDKLVEGLASWLNSGNPKVSNSVDVLAGVVFTLAHFAASTWSCATG